MEDKQLATSWQKFQELVANNECRQALSLLKRTALCLLKAHEPYRINWVPRLAILASMYTQLGEYHRAIPLLKRAFTLSESEFGPDHEDTLHVLGDLALCYFWLEDYVSAEPLLLKFFEARAKVLDPSDGAKVTHLLTMLACLVTAYDRLGDIRKGDLYSDRAWAIYDEFVNHTGKDDFSCPDGLMSLKAPMAFLVVSKRLRHSVERFVRTKLTKRFFMGLPAGVYLVSNVYGAPPRPCFADTVGPVETREAQWERVTQGGAARRLCNVFKSETDYNDYMSFSR